MPSWIALGTTALASVHERLLPIPVLVLGGVFPALLPLFHLVLVPFSLAATSVKHVGVALQALLLLQAVMFEAIGSGLNSLASSSPSSALALSTARAEASALEATYQTRLAAFYGDHFEPLVPSSDPIPLTQEDVDEWERDGIVLKKDLERGIAESIELWSTVLDDNRIDYLNAVKDELDRIQARRPTVYLYRDGGAESIDEVEIERSDQEHDAERTKQLDAKFEAFLDQMGMDDNARATLDNPSDPSDPSSDSFRQLLRSGWERMFGNGGVMGNVETELGGLFGRGGDDDDVFDLGMGAPMEPGDSVDDKLSSPEYKPGRIPLMTIHLLRDQLGHAIASLGAASTSNGLAQFLEPEDSTDAQILPNLSRKVSDDYLGFLQRAVKVDVRARDLALRVLAQLSPSSSSSSSSSLPSSQGPLSVAKNSHARPSILLSPRPGFPDFVKKLDWTLTRSSERFLSKHEFAQAAFGAEQGYFALRKKEREVARLEREVGRHEANEAREEL
ncbi:hypothetical protein JCM11491_007008 [Sporobolomyces phaffii]